MAVLATNKILNTIEWAKKMNFGRRSALGNFLEPALTSANIVLQTILGPPFEWWWNAEDLTFTANPIVTPATVTNTVLTSNVATYTASQPHGWNTGQVITVIGTTNGGGIFNVANAVITAVPSSTTLQVTIIASNVASAADSGTIIVNPQDYALNVPEFGWIEDAGIQDVTTGNWMQLEIKNSLQLDSTIARPRFICPRTVDPNTGNVVFRLMQAPDKPYPVSVHIQKAPALLTSVNGTWSPIPDYFSYIYSWGFLALMYMFADDPRFAIANQKFIAHLLGAAEGLDEQQKNIFLNNWNNLTSMQQQKVQQGIQSRAV